MKMKSNKVLLIFKDILLSYIFWWVLSPKKAFSNSEITWNTSESKQETFLYSELKMSFSQLQNPGSTPGQKAITEHIEKLIF